jgi:hypothetical protein
LIDERQHSSIVDVQYFTDAGCDITIWWLQKLGRVCKHENESSDSIKGRGFLGQLSD